ncbi:Uncharacterised protein [Serratia entomophila]|uniref:Uncharacterized protein n=1 Tax=Serratia entomophila TaxID=42906 RepID=A0ABY5CNA2_9GAMM|nr:hypothetical protein [Serratia entomophila]UIW16807.1 hypothetical protein KHA73_15295 [Serratia entomophila]USU99363.1 hypothetical protein KFQ06_14970 [Serratia entomophila]CAI0716929.1 Uncharacterised protein [Serratia entomophila]CAI0718964.1 Uncharacterised protein [Serratia entomophila]CAI0719031.1 Uncharacterised protein [Serratia entomophila]
MAITEIKVSECFSYIEDAGKRRFEIKIFSASSNDLKDKGVSVYYDETDLLLAATGIEKNLQPAFELALDQNVEEFMSIVRKEGFKTYRIRVEENIADGTIGEVFFNDIQFLDVEPEITNIIIDDDDEQGTANVQVLVKYYSPGVSLSLTNEKYDKEFEFSDFEYDEVLEVWKSEILVDKSFGKCNEKLKFSINGEYLGVDLPCTSEWSTHIELDETLNGVCMNTNWQPGFNIFWDDVSNDSIRDLQVTSKSGYMLATYYAPQASTRNYTLMTRMQTPAGALRQPLSICNLQGGINKDANTTTIDGTDNFVAVWAGNFSGRFKIYGRPFTAGQNGITSTEFQEIDLSGGNGDYTCPRIIYNPTSKLLLATWVSVAEKKIQGVFLDPNTLEKMSYDFDISTNIHTGYNSAGIDLGTTTVENIVLMNHGEKIVIAYLEKVGELKFLSIGKPVGGTPPVNPMTQYSQAQMGKFHAALDPQTNNIMLVYVLGQDIYGAKLKVFAKEGAEVYAANKLNSISSGNPSFPYINKAVTAQENYEFHVAWSSASLGAFFNRFDENFFSIDAETQVNGASNNSSMYPKLAASDNQLAMLFQATRYDSIALKGQGILSYVKARN